MPTLDDLNMRRCPRCNKSYTSGEICDFCKNDLILNYDHNVDWKTAYQIELDIDASQNIEIDF